MAHNVGIFNVENNVFSVLSWSSKRVKRIARSTIAAETLALKDAIDNAIFLIAFLNF